MKNTLLAVTALVALGMLSLPAQAVEYFTDATMGPILNGGKDPQGLNGFSGKFTCRISGTANPTSSTATSATYSVPAGAVKLVANSSIGAHTLKSTGAATLTISVPAKGVNKITVTGPFMYRGTAFNMTWVFSLPNGSFSTKALKHPTKFSPTTIAISEPASNLTYTEGGTTKLGVGKDGGTIIAE
jgi:hypothetical protein